MTHRIPQIALLLTEGLDMTPMSHNDSNRSFVLDLEVVQKPVSCYLVQHIMPQELVILIQRCISSKVFIQGLHDTATLSGTDRA